MSDITEHIAHKVINGLMGFYEIFLQQETLILYSRQYWHLCVKQQGILLQPPATWQQIKHYLHF